MKVHFAVCSPFSSHGNSPSSVLPDRNKMLCSVTCLKALSMCLASALNEGRTALPITVLAIRSREGRGTGSQYQDNGMLLDFHNMRSGRDSVNQATLMKVHQWKINKTKTRKASKNPSQLQIIPQLCLTKKQGNSGQACAH